MVPAVRLGIPKETTWVSPFTVFHSIPLFPLLLVLMLSLLVTTTGPARAQEAEADVLVAETVLAYDEKRYEEALKLADQALNLVPDHIEALYYKGLVLFAQEQVEAGLRPLEKAHQLAPDNVSVTFQLGVTYFSLERYQEADPLLTQVFNDRPETKNVGYYVGFMRYRNKDYQGALRAFGTSTPSDDPRIRQLTKFYSGLALSILGLPEQAVVELAESSRIRTVSPLTGPADRLRDTLVAARKGEKRFSGQIHGGVFYDTNVPVVPLSTGDPTVTTLRNRDKNSSGELVSVRGDYSWLRDGPVESIISYTFFQTYNNDLPAFNVRNHLVSLSGFYRNLVAGMPLRTGLQFSFDNTELGDDQFLKRYSLAIPVTLVESSRHLTTLQGRFQYKDFNQSELSKLFSTVPALTEDVRDAKNWMIGFSHLLRFQGDRHLIRLGYQFDSDRAKGDNFKYNGHRLQAGVLFTLPSWDTRLRYDYDVHFRKYDDPHTRFNKRGLLPVGAAPSVTQKVTQHTHSVRLEQPLPYNLTFAIDWQGSFSRSNIDLLFNYNRNVITTSLSWVF